MQSDLTKDYLHWVFETPLETVSHALDVGGARNAALDGHSADARSSSRTAPTSITPRSATWLAFNRTFDSQPSQGGRLPFIFALSRICR